MTPGITSRQYLFDGDTLVGEYRGSLWFGPYVHGPGEDEPLFLLDNQGRRFWMHSDERGSIIAWSVPNGTASAIATYDEYGQRGLAPGRFGYAGKPWHGAAKIYNNRARWYDPKLGRFLQTDPIGYDGGINLYAYVGNDPANRADPAGECATVKSESGVTIEVGICGTSPDAQKLVEGRIADTNSAIGNVEAVAVSQKQRVQFDLASHRPTLDHAQVSGGWTGEGILPNGSKWIGVTLDPNDRVEVYGYDAETGEKASHVSTLEETAEHEIGQHVLDRLTGGPHNDEVGAAQAENKLRERRGESFRRVGHAGKLLPPL